MKNIKYILLTSILIGFTACNEDEYDYTPDPEPLPALTAGEADFTKYVAVGASFTAGYTDNALFINAQENSFPNTIAKEFAKIGGGNFVQPLMNDNIGGLLLGGQQDSRFAPRLYFYSDQDPNDDFDSGPYPLGIVPHLNDFIGEIPTTEAFNNIGSNFNNFGIPGAKSYHLTAPGFAAANPYYTRIASGLTASVLSDAMAQNPTFFTLSEVGGNDVLGYATSGGDGSDPITPIGTFDFALNTLVSGLTANNAKGVIGNLPNITSLSHFTTVPHNPLSPTNPDFAPQIPLLNATFAPLNQAFAFLGMPERAIVFSETEASPVVIHDESLPNIQPQLNAVLIGGGLDAATAGVLSAQFAQSRQATADDLLVLPSSSVIATVNVAYYTQLVTAGVPAATAGQLSVNGVTFPLEDKWVLLPQEQDEIAMATQAYNASISAAASANGLALVDLNAILEEASSTGIVFDDYTLNTDLVFGGLVSLDGVHLTARGYALMANSFLKAIDATYGSNFEASGNLAKAGDFPTNYSPTLQ